MPNGLDLVHAVDGRACEGLAEGVRRILRHTFDGTNVVRLLLF